MQSDRTNSTGASRTGVKQPKPEREKSQLDYSQLPIDGRDEISELEVLHIGYYSALPEDIEKEDVRNYIPWWVDVCGAEEGSRGSDSLHFPAEGSSKEDVEKLCGTAVSDSSTLKAKEIPVYPPGYATKCTRCMNILESSAANE